jgi:mannan endo-1,4-beta-mannosidase
MRRLSRTWVTVAATACIMVAAGAIALASIKYHYRVAEGATAADQAAGSTPSVALPRFVHASLPSTGFRYLGVYEGSSTSPRQYALVEQFAQAVGRQPNIVMSYSSWEEPFSISYAETARQHGATLLIDLDPGNTSCASIAAGHQDAFLESYAESVKAFGHPVIISFGHEMNGTWYPWGWTHTKPAAFVQAWRHVVDVFRQVGADNVTWLWTINSVASYEGPIADYWPGASYVTWVAFDAYYYSPDDDFSGVFGPSIAALRHLTTKPILIGETAAGQLSGQASKIPGLFAGVLRAGLLGFVWYDQGQTDGVFHQDWRLEGNPGAVASFRAAATAYLGNGPDGRSLTRRLAPQRPGGDVHGEGRLERRLV